MVRPQLFLQRMVSHGSLEDNFHQRIRKLSKERRCVVQGVDLFAPDLLSEGVDKLRVYFREHTSIVLPKRRGL